VGEGDQEQDERAYPGERAMQLVHRTSHIHRRPATQAVCAACVGWGASI
jgi:hypothetical protein